MMVGADEPPAQHEQLTGTYGESDPDDADDVPVVQPVRVHNRPQPRPRAQISAFRLSFCPSSL